MDFSIPDSIKRIPTKFFSYVSLGNDLLLTGGQYIEDKTCGIDTFKINVNK